MLSSSTLMWLLGISAFQVLGGIAAGWWLHATKRAATQNNEILGKRLTDALARLQTLAGDMSVDASQHAEQVAAVGRKINAAADGDVEQLHEVLVSGMSNIMESNRRLQTQLNDVEVKLEEQARQIESQLIEARIDSLTGIANRRAFDEELLRRLAEWRRRHTPTSLLLIDIDNFKKINDTQGHPAGDAILRETARVLQKTMREMDFTARFGGEEFAVILPNTPLIDARRAAQRALKAVAQHPFEYEGREVRVTISLGLAEVMPSDDSATFVRRADEALYLSKSAGRNCGHFHSGTDFLSLDSPRIIESDTPTPTAPAGEAPSLALYSEAPPAPAPRPQPARTTLSSSQPNLVDTDEDPLTGLPGAPPFSSEMRRRVQRARSEDRPLTLLLVDVDYLGEMNRKSGTSTGDRVLRRLADILRSTARDCDFAARYHDGQFALALYSVGANEATRTAERIRRALTAAAYENGSEIPETTVCCGIAEAGPGDRSVSLLMRASTALAAAKSAGRDCVFVHDGRNVEPADETAAS